MDYDKLYQDFFPPVTIEKHKRLSDSYLWTYQEDYFHQSGIEAWVNKVPFYVTSNPFISNCYANLFVQFVRDYTTQHPTSKADPFYVVELGTGSGRFSFYAIKKIVELLKDYQIEDVKICYVMSDFTHNNVEFWKQHPALKPFVEKGVLDFAVFHMETDKQLMLVNQNISLSANSLKNPLTIFANYIFDTVKHDAFSLSEKTLSELYISMSTQKDNLENGKPLNWDLVNIDYEPVKIEGARYADPEINAVLMEYENSGLDQTHFLFPIGALQAIQKLLRFSNNKLFLISSDKGYSSLESMAHLSYPRPSFHGSFSMMVNFDAIGRFFKKIGGDFMLQTPREGLQTAVFTSGFTLDTMPQTALAIKQSVEGFSPADYFTLHRRVRDHFESYDLPTLASHLVFAGWDPHIYNRISRQICSLLHTSQKTTVDFLAAHMPKLMENFYVMPNVDNLPFEIGTFFLNLERYQEALDYYQLAAPLIKEERFDYYFNVGIAQYYVGEPKLALEQFKKALSVAPESEEAKEWITFLTASPA
jgi:hypothetical protein